MKNLVLVLFLLVAGMSGIGIYRGWVTMNRQKIEQDGIAARAEVHVLEQKAKDTASELKSPLRDRK